MTENEKLYKNLIKKYGLVPRKFYKECYVPNIPCFRFNGTMLNYDANNDIIFVCEDEPSCYYDNIISFSEFNICKPESLDGVVCKILKYLNNLEYEYKKKLIWEKIKMIDKDFE